MNDRYLKQLEAEKNFYKELGNKLIIKYDEKYNELENKYEEIKLFNEIFEKFTKYEDKFGYYDIYNQLHVNISIPDYKIEEFAKCMEKFINNIDCKYGEKRDLFSYKFIIQLEKDDFLFIIELIVADDFYTFD